MLANPLPEERRVSPRVQQRGFAFLLRLFILVLAGQQSVPLLRQVVDPAAVLKASSALAGFLLAPQAALAQVPARPTGTAGDGQVALSWTNPSDASIQSYKVRYQKRGESAWTEAAIAGSDASTTSYTVTGLENGYTYNLEICAVRAGTCSGWSSTAYAAPRTTSTTVPAKLAGFSATGGGQVGDIKLDGSNGPVHHWISI